jgi:hypothetical protein
VLTVAPFLFLACNAEPTAPADPAAAAFKGDAASAAASVDQFVFRSGGGAGVDFYVSCTGGSMHMQGSFALYIKDVTTPDGQVHKLWINRLGDDWTLTGNTTGTEWDLQYDGYNLVNVVQFNESGLGFEAYHEHLRFLNPETGTVLVLDTRFHFSMNAAGEIKVDRGDLSACRLIH